MKLSEAIALGSQLQPQVFEDLYNGEGTCALGAAADALGLIGKYVDPQHRLVVQFPRLHEAARCPACGLIRGAWRRWRGFEYDLEDVIVHLNDNHRWTRIRIAAHVATLEGADAPEILFKPSTADATRTISLVA